MPQPLAALLLHTTAVALCCAALMQPAAAETQDEANADHLPTTSATAPMQPPQPPQPPLIVSPDGSLVIDTRARLAWPRCVEGMRWDGRRCAGVARLMTYGEAQAQARQRWQADGVRWRLPRVNELRRLVNRKTQPPSVDAQLFPFMPRDWVWTGTASVNTNTVNPYAYGNVARGGAGESNMSVQQSWAVDMSSGEARGDVGRATRLHVQLVRPAP